MDILDGLDSIPVNSFYCHLLFIIGWGWLFDATATGLVIFLPVLGQETRKRFYRSRCKIYLFVFA